MAFNIRPIIEFMSGNVRVENDLGKSVNFNLINLLAILAFNYLSSALAVLEYPVVFFLLLLVTEVGSTVLINLFHTPRFCAWLTFNFFSLKSCFFLFRNLLYIYPKITFLVDKVTAPQEKSCPDNNQLTRQVVGRGNLTLKIRRKMNFLHGVVAWWVETRLDVHWTDVWRGSAAKRKQMLLVDYLVTVSDLNCLFLYLEGVEEWVTRLRMMSWWLIEWWWLIKWVDHWKE